MAVIAASLKPHSVLIATDFSEASEKVLRHSLALARSYGSRFCLAHVVSSLGARMAGPGAIAACEEAVLREAAQLEASLVRSGALAGIQHKFIVRRGEPWPELQQILRQESADLVIVGTNGRQGVARLFFGSIAEHILRQASCPVLVFGPRSRNDCWIESPSKHPTFLFATDFGKASLQGLPQAIALANHFEARLAFLNVVSASPPQRGLDADIREPRNSAYQQAVRRLTELAGNANLHVTPECHVVFQSTKPVSETILETAQELRADLIIMALHSPARSGLTSRLRSTTGYDVVCQAISPVLSVYNPSGKISFGPAAAEITAPPLSDADLIRIRGFGVKW